MIRSEPNNSDFLDRCEAWSSHFGVLWISIATLWYLSYFLTWACQLEHRGKFISVCAFPFVISQCSCHTWLCSYMCTGTISMLTEAQVNQVAYLVASQHHHIWSAFTVHMQSGGKKFFRRKSNLYCLWKISRPASGLEMYASIKYWQEINKRDSFTIERQH